MKVLARKTWILIGFLAAAVAFISGCGDATDATSTEDDAAASGFEYVDRVDDRVADHHGPRMVVVGEHNRGDHFSDDGIGRFEYPESFRQVGMMMQAESIEPMGYRVRGETDDWRDWKSLEARWNEGELYNATIVVDEPVDAIEFRGGDSLKFAQIYFSGEVTARFSGEEPPGGVDDRPRDADGVETVRQLSVAPDDMVTDRYEWDAIDPGKICNDVVEPYRMTIHHTASPDSDGGDAAARMRQMQEFHIYDRGWCDIGYHFVVAQSGEIFQGRSRSNRPGAHVGGENWGNVGISLIGDYMETHPPDTQIENAAVIANWAHTEHDIPRDRDSVKGHREWPDQPTSCPGDIGLSYVDEIIDRAADIGADRDVDVSVSIDGLDDFYTQGTSASVSDAFAGEEFTADIRVTNRSSTSIHDVWLEYDFDGVGVEALDYRIESDHPAYDQESWELNDASDAEANPPGDELGEEGVLDLYAFSAGETKRIVVEMETTEYNLGVADFAGVRAWIHQIADVYGVQEEYGQTPETNQMEDGELLQAHGRVDVLSRAEWRFQTGEPQDLEGWTGGDYAELNINASEDVLALNAEAPGAYVDAPQWTEVDADEFDELVLRVRSHDGAHSKTVYWSGPNGDFSEERLVRFESPGDGDYHTLVVPVGEHPQWSGEVTGLRLELLDDQPEDGFESGWYDVDHIYFQNGSTGETTSETLGSADGTVVELGMDGEGTEDSSTGAFPGVSAEDGGTIEVNEGCVAVGAGGGEFPGWLVVALIVLGAVRLGGGREDAG